MAPRKSKSKMDRSKKIGGTRNAVDGTQPSAPMFNQGVTKQTTNPKIEGDRKFIGRLGNMADRVAREQTLTRHPKRGSSVEGSTFELHFGADTYIDVVMDIEYTKTYSIDFEFKTDGYIGPAFGLICAFPGIASNLEPMFYGFRADGAGTPRVWGAGTNNGLDSNPDGWAAQDIWTPVNYLVQADGAQGFLTIGTRVGRSLTNGLDGTTVPNPDFRIGAGTSIGGAAQLYFDYGFIRNVTIAVDGVPNFHKFDLNDGPTAGTVIANTGVGGGANGTLFGSTHTWVEVQAGGS